VLLLLVRHAPAGSKRHWHGDDRVRPLSPLGLVEAEALGPLLAPFGPTRIVSSPYLRCVQTVTPLATTLGVRIERSKRLVPSAGTSAELFVRRVSRKDNDAVVVLCTHGEVIADFQEHLSKSSPELFGDDRRREKGSVWILDRVEGRIVRSTYLPPSA
jgi:8-oxo-dGTP diphosphatase